MMEKTIFSKKHAFIKLSLVLLFVALVFSFVAAQAVDFSVYAQEGEALENDYGFDVSLGNYTQGTFLRVKSDDQYPVFTLSFNNKTGWVSSKYGKESVSKWILAPGTTLWASCDKNST